MKLSSPVKSKLSKQLNAWIGPLLEQRWFNLGLRAKMVAMVTIGLVGLLTIFSLLGISTTRQTTQQVLDERVLLARLTASSLDASLRHVESMLSVMAKNPVLLDPEASQAQRQSALGEMAIPNKGIYLFDTQGQMLAAASGSWINLDLGSSTALQSALQGQDFGLSMLAGAPRLGKGALVLLAIPVHDPAGLHQGALVALLDLAERDVFPLESAFSLGGTGNLDIVAANGLVLVSTRPERILSTSDEGGIVSNLFVAGKPGVESCLGCSGGEANFAQDEVIAFAPLKLAPWGVVVRQKAQEVFAPVRRLTTLTLALGLATVIGALGLVWVTTNSVINPVQHLTSAAQRIAGGDLSTPVEPPISQPSFGGRFLGRNNRLDEIGTLTESFIQMRQQLKRSMDEIRALNRDLDRRVQERTQAARKAQLEAQAARDDLRAVIDALSDELMVIDTESYRILQANRSASNGVGTNGSGALGDEDRVEDAYLVGSFCYEVCHCGKPCLPPDCQCPLPEVVERNASVRVTHVRNCPETGEDRYVDIVASPLRDAAGNITRVVELRRDVSEEHRIRESLVRSNQQLSIVNAVALTINQSLDLGDILGRALQEVLNLTEIDAGVVFLQEEALGKLEMVAYQGISKEAARLAAQIGLLDSSCGGVADRGQIVIVPDLKNYRGRRARSLRRENLSTLVHVPLIARGSVLGSMCVGTCRKRDFSQEEQELLMTLGSQIATAIENARLYAELQYKEKLRGELFKKAINAQEDERKRIARELHDETSQALTALLFAAEESLEMEELEEVHSHISRMHELVQHTLDGVHKVIFDLRPSMLDHLGLVPALRWLVETRLESRQVRVEIDERTPALRLPSEVETALFRVVQEAVSNIARHAAARNVTIAFLSDEQGVQLIVEDDGVGFDLTQFHEYPASPRGLGLLGMRERVELLGGELDIQAEPGRGTCLHIRVPLQERKEAYA